MLPNNHLRLLVHLDYEQRQGLISVAAAAATQDSPQLLSVHRVIGLLQVNEGCELSSLLALPWVDLSEESGYVCSCGGALFEAGLVYPRL